jgi:hypothetical protein
VEVDFAVFFETSELMMSLPKRYTMILLTVYNRFLDKCSCTGRKYAVTWY